MSLFDPFLIQSGWLESLLTTKRIVWFEKVSVSYLIQNIIFPLLLSILAAFVLKYKYDTKKKQLNMHNQMNYNW